VGILPFINDKNFYERSKMKVLFSSLFAVLVFITSPVFAGEKKMKETASNLSISHIWGKPNYGPNGAAYFTLKNNGKTARHLIGASSPLSDRVELHTHLKEDGVMKMRKMKDGIIVKPGETLHFKPAGNHIMLMSMKEKLKPGATYDLQLKFKDGSTEKLKVAIKDKDHAKEHRGSNADDKRGSSADEKRGSASDEKRGSGKDEKRGSGTDEKKMKKTESRGSDAKEKRGSE
jgi:copper(I)-binding protein